MIEWVTKADPYHLICLNPEVAKKKFNIDFWYNTEDGGQHYILPGNHGLLPPAPPAPLPLSQGDGATPPQAEPSQRVEAASSGATPLV